jgi:hypothetical protein
MHGSRRFRVVNWIFLFCVLTAATAGSLAAPAAAAPAPPSTDTYVRWVLTNVAGLDPSDDDVAAYRALLDAGVSRERFARFAVQHPQPVGFMVQLAYQGALGRDLDEVGARFWVGDVLSGRRSVAGAHIAIASSAEALRRNGGTAATWVDAPYHLFLRRDPTPREVSFWAARATTPQGRVEVARAIHHSAEARRAFVRFFAEMVLGRTLDARGEAYWSGRLLHIGELGLAAGFLASDEFFRRTGSIT